MKLNPKLTPLETNSLSLNSTYFDNIDFNYVVKAGKVVEVSLRALVKANIPNNITIMTLPYKSYFGTEIPLYLGGRYDYFGGTIFSYIADRDIRTGAISSGQYLHAQFTYITTD